MLWNSSPVWFFACSGPIFPTQFIKETVFSIVCSCLLCCRLIEHVSVSSLFCSIDLCVCFFCANTILVLGGLLAMLHSLQDLSSPTRDWTHAPCSGTWSSNPCTAREFSVPYCFDYCTFYYNLKLEKMILPALLFFLRITLTLWGLLTSNLRIIWSDSVKNAIGILIGIALTM